MLISMDDIQIDSLLDLEMEYQTYKNYDPALESEVVNGRHKVWENIKKTCRGIVEIISRMVQNLILKISTFINGYNRKFKNSNPSFWVKEEHMTEMMDFFKQSRKNIEESEIRLNNLSDLADSIEIDGETIPLEGNSISMDACIAIEADVEIMQSRISEIHKAIKDEYDDIYLEIEHKGLATSFEKNKIYSSHGFTPVTWDSLKSVSKYISTLGYTHGNKIITYTKKYANDAIKKNDANVKTETSNVIINAGRRLMGALNWVKDHVSFFINTILAPSRILNLIVSNPVLSDA